jgi:hypothetical protein
LREVVAVAARKFPLADFLDSPDSVLGVMDRDAFSDPG